MSHGNFILDLDKNLQKSPLKIKRTGFIKIKKRKPNNPPASIYGTKKYKLWRELVFKRDNHQCQWPGCGSKGYIEAHHIRKKSKYPELTYVVDNGVALCKHHHVIVTGKEDEYIVFFEDIVRKRKQAKLNKRIRNMKNVRKLGSV